ncbi:MAG: hypothetical protein AAF635_00780 [Cyanobacteria bacterium P01_C01_bin.69]
MTKLSPKRWLGAFTIATLLVSGLPQLAVPVLRAATSNQAYAQSTNGDVRLSRQLIYDNNNSVEQFRDDRIDYRLTLENRGGDTFGGVPVTIDGQRVQRVMVASALPAGTYLSAYPVAPTGWQAVYSVNNRQQTGQSNDSMQVSWTTNPSNIRQVRRVAFVRSESLSAYEIVDGLNFGVRLTDLPAQAPGVRNTTEVYAVSNGSSRLIASDESFYSDIDGIEVAVGRLGKPTPDVAEVPSVAVEPVVVAEVPTEPPVEIAEPVQTEVAEPEASVVVVEPEQTCSFGRVPSHFSVGVDSELGGAPAFPSIGGFIPVAQVPGRNLTYINGIGRLDDFSDLGANAIVGHRFYDGGGDRIYGGYLAYDLANTGESTFNQIGVGLETLGEVWDGRLNAYIPLEGRQLIEENENENIFEDPLTTIEAEVAANVFSFENAGDARVFLSPYYYTGENTFGGRAGITAEPFDGISVGTSVQIDDIFDTQVAFNINYRFGTSPTRELAEQDGNVATDQKGNPCRRLPRLDAPVRRTAPVRVDVQLESVPVVEPDEPVVITCDPGFILINGECIGAFSDITLKEKVEYLTTTDAGFKLYAFDYVEHPLLPEGRFVGVMAQDLLPDNPEAVSTDENGQYLVDYAALGLRMVAYSDWKEHGLSAVITN